MPARSVGGATAVEITLSERSEGRKTEEKEKEGKRDRFEIILGRARPSYNQSMLRKIFISHFKNYNIHIWVNKWKI